MLIRGNMRQQAEIIMHLREFTFPWDREVNAIAKTGGRSLHGVVELHREIDAGAEMVELQRG